jgi:hemolysin III
LTVWAEGLHKPALRGYLHVLTSIILPAASYFIIVEAKSLVTLLLTGVYVAMLIVGHIVSSALHRVEWSPYWENVVLKLDHASIFLMVRPS